VPKNGRKAKAAPARRFTIQAQNTVIGTEKTFWRLALLQPDHVGQYDISGVDVVLAMMQ